jgi:hypothetical protein
LSHVENPQPAKDGCDGLVAVNLALPFADTKLLEALYSPQVRHFGIFSAESDPLGTTFSSASS